MPRHYLIKHESQPWRPYAGSFSYGRLDALRAYASDHLPGWQVLSAGHHAGNHEGHALYAAEAINPEQTMGARLWVCEPY